MRRLASLALFAAALPAHAITLHVSAPALERTLRAQLFTTPDPASGKLTRYYLKGSPQTPCGSYAEDPHLFFDGERVHVKLHTHSKFGTTFKGTCLGISLNSDAEVSFIPTAEGETIGFRDARIEHASENKELNFLLEPFLAKKLPAEMRVDAAKLMRTLLLRAPDQTGYKLTLLTLDLRSMRVDGQLLLVDLDADLNVD